MAIEDAVVLAKCLRDVSGIEAAFAAYEVLRRERVERVVAQGRRNGSGKAPGPIGRVIRDLALRVVFRKGSRPVNSMRWLFDHAVDWDTPCVASKNFCAP
jgi:FAD-dependent urate hydroxylase